MLYGSKPKAEPKPLPTRVEQERLMAEYIKANGVTKCKPGDSIYNGYSRY